MKLSDLYPFKTKPRSFLPRQEREQLDEEIRKYKMLGQIVPQQELAQEFNCTENVTATAVNRITREIENSKAEREEKIKKHAALEVSSFMETISQAEQIMEVIGARKGSETAEIVNAATGFLKETGLTDLIRMKLTGGIAPPAAITPPVLADPAEQKKQMIAQHADFLKKVPKIFLNPDSIIGQLTCQPPEMLIVIQQTYAEKADIEQLATLAGLDMKKKEIDQIFTAIQSINLDQKTLSA
jgi:hypothetical protein